MSTTSLNLIKSLSQFSKSRVKEVGDGFCNANAITPGMNDEEENTVNDKCILSKMFGEFLLSGLVLSAQNKVKIEAND